MFSLGQIMNKLKEKKGLKNMSTFLHRSFVITLSSICTHLLLPSHNNLMKKWSEDVFAPPTQPGIGLENNRFHKLIVSKH